jgi:hypothetical protein
MSYHRQLCVKHTHNHFGHKRYLFLLFRILFLFLCFHSGFGIEMIIYTIITKMYYFIYFIAMILARNSRVKTIMIH